MEESVNLGTVIAMATSKAKEYGIYTTEKYTFVNDDERDTYFSIAENYAELNNKTKIFMDDSNIMMIYTGNLSLPYDGDNFNAIMGASGSNLAISAGRITESILTYNEGLGTVTISEGRYRLFHTSDFRGEATDHTLPAITLSFDADKTAYVAVSWNDGNPIMYMEYDSSQFNNSSIVVPYTISRVSSDNTSSGFSVLDWGLEGVGLSNKSVERFLDTARFARANGLDLSVDDLGAVLISSGAVYAGVSKQIFADTTSNADECFLRIKTATGWDRQSALTFPNDKYDSSDGSGLRDLTDGYYGIVWVYRDMGTPKRIHLILGNEQFVGSEEASASSLPNDVDALLDSDALLIGNVIFEKGSYDNLIVKSAFDKVFVPSLVNDHQGLANLQGGELGKYYHLPLKNQEDYILAVDFDNKLIGVGTNDFSTIDPDNVPKMIIKSERDSRNIVIISSDTNEYTQVNLKNKNVGDKASVNIVCSADNSSSSEHHYVSMGIASSVFSDPLFTIASPDDGHLSVAGGNLAIGTVSAKDIIFATGGAMAENERLRFVDDDSSLKYTIKTHKPNIDKIDSFIFTKANGVTSILKIDTLNDKAIIDKIEYDLKTQAQIDALSPTESLTVFNTTTKELNYYNGTTWINLGSANKITDVDGDTKIEVEQSEDEDIIRFTVVGQEKLNMSHVADTTKFNTQPTFIINDGTKDRLNINDVDVSLYSPDTFSRNTLGNGYVNTIVDDKERIIVSSATIIIKDDDGEIRVSVDASSTSISSSKVGLGTSAPKIYSDCSVVGEPTLAFHDGNIPRVLANKDIAQIVSPDGESDVTVTDGGTAIKSKGYFRAVDGITNNDRISVTPDVTKLLTQKVGLGSSTAQIYAHCETVGQPTLGMFDGNMERVVIDKDSSRIYSPDGTSLITITDDYYDVNIGGKSRIEASSTRIRLCASNVGLGTYVPQLSVQCDSVGEPVLSFLDGNKNRLYIDKTSSCMYSPDNASYIRVENEDITYVSSLVARIYIDSDSNVFRSPNGAKSISLSNIETLVNGDLSVEGTVRSTGVIVSGTHYMNANQRYVSGVGNCYLNFSGEGETTVGNTKARTYIYGKDLKVNDGTINRVNVDSYNSLVYSPDGNSSIGVSDTGTNVTGNFTVDGTTVSTGSTSKVIKLINGSLTDKSITIGGAIFMFSNTNWSSNAKVMVRAESSIISNVGMNVRKSSDNGVTYVAEYNTGSITTGSSILSSTNWGIDSGYDILDIDICTAYDDGAPAKYWKVRAMSSGWSTLTMAVTYMEE